MNPYGAQGRPIRNPSETYQYSGFAKEVRIGRPGRINIQLAKIAPAGYTGLAALHIAVHDVSAEPDIPVVGPSPTPVENTVLIGTLTWESGSGGGTQVIDLTRGGLVPVGGTDAIGLELELVSSVQGEAPILWRSKHVSLTVNWFGNANENPSYTSPGLRMAGAGTSPFIPIPLMSSATIVQTDTPALLPALIAEFSTNQDPAGSGIKYRTLNPNANGTKIGAGVEFARVVTTGGGLFFFVWELH